MPQSREKLYKALSAGELIGPDHHKFQLRDKPTQCPLGQLWQADDVSTKNPINVSLIILDPVFLDNKSFLANFKKQIVRSKAINHSHITDIYGYFIHKGGLLFFAFEPIDGLTLEQLISSSASKNLNPKQTQGLLTQLASAIHGCVKQWHSALGGLDSQFVFVNKKGGVKLLPISMREFFHEAEKMPKSVYTYKSFCSPKALAKGAIGAESDTYTIASAAYTLLGNDELGINDSEQQRKEYTFIRPSDIDDQQWQCLLDAFSDEDHSRFTSALDFIKQFYPPDNNAASAASDSATNEDGENNEGNEESSSQNKSKSAPINFKLGKLSINFRLPFFAIPLLIFIAGTGLGFILGVFSSSQKIDAVNEQLAASQQQAAQFEAESDTANEQLRGTIERINTLTIKNKAMRLQIGEGTGNSPLSVFRDPLPGGKYGPHMVVIAPGSFIMGNDSNDANDNEKPAHKVTFTKKFAIARHEITFAQYDVFAQQTNRALPDDEGWGRGSQPVINVTWRDARAYTRWLAKQTKLDYRLPTEAEWEYAARAGTKTNYWWGDKSKPGYAQCSDCGHPLSGKQPLPVGSLKANPWGLYDFNGNVDEWVLDCYTPDHKKAKSDGSPYQTPGCKNYTMRGGSWFDISRITRSASRYRHPPKTKRNAWGFRVALEIEG